MIKLTTTGKAPGIYGLFDKETGAEIFRGLKAECAKYACCEVKNLEYHYYQHKKGLKTKFPFLIKKVGNAERKTNKMMSKDEFVNGLLEAQEERNSAIEEAESIVKDVAKKETRSLKAEKNTNKTQPTAENKSAVEKAFNNLVNLILTETDKENNLYWYTKGILAVLGESDV